MQVLISLIEVDPLDVTLNSVMVVENIGWPWMGYEDGVNTPLGGGTQYFGCVEKSTSLTIGWCFVRNCLTTADIRIFVTKYILYCLSRVHVVASYGQAYEG